MIKQKSFTDNIGLKGILSTTIARNSHQESSELLRNSHIWAVYLDTEGNRIWDIDAPDQIPDHFTVQDVAVFAKGYLADYPVFIRNTDDGMLILCYPQDSYMKLPGNYYSLRSIKAFPFFILGILAADFTILFIAYYFSKRKILKNARPIITPHRNTRRRQAGFPSRTRGTVGNSGQRQ